jgi:activator of HSP90 ATPase
MAKRSGIIKQTVLIPAEPEKVYEAFLNPKRHAEFTGAAATGRPRVGGKFTAWDGYISGKNLKLKKGKQIVQEWRTTEWPPGQPSSLVDFQFRKKAGGTELRMVHSKLPHGQTAYYLKGWTEFYWRPLKRYFKAKRTRG